jgi:hypothetical protein
VEAVISCAGVHEPEIRLCVLSNASAAMAQVLLNGVKAVFIRISLNNSDVSYLLVKAV